MRNKIKQLLKKEGGFTLVELLAVIVILGFIVAISIPLIGNVIEGAGDRYGCCPTRIGYRCGSNVRTKKTAYLLLELLLMI